MLKHFIFILFVLSSITISAQRNNDLKDKLHHFLFEKHRSVDISQRNTEKHSKLVAAGLNISLGLFGVHRLYLGTSPKIPVIYTFTLGGGGFLMLSDLGVIIFTKDLEQFSNNPNVIMWSDLEKD
jgi:TM2 domain-containing membrane protein YozV